MREKLVTILYHVEHIANEENNSKREADRTILLDERGRSIDAIMIIIATGLTRPKRDVNKQP